MKRAGRESRRLRALASAWEIQEVEHYAKLMRHMHKQDYMKYGEYMADEGDDLHKDRYEHCGRPRGGPRVV